VLPSVLTLAQDIVRRALVSGDTAVDATLGNGRDTLFLADCVGPTGHVVGFDVQAVALAETSKRLYASGIAERVTLVHRGHEDMSSWFSQFAPSTRLKAVMFNLGYRPGGDRSLITRPETTIAALSSSIALVLPGGVITVVVYPGHEGGRTEADALLSWTRTVRGRCASIALYQFLNSSSPSPFLIAISPH
jgi:glyoxylase-like metal-dependent hydrolase (beta-lactamase superfamily II)